VKVEVVDADPTMTAQPTGFAMAAAQRSTEPEIPADWRELDWPELRSLASSVSETAVINKEQAVEAIEAELGRRAQGDDA
jgi:hypothetical protein